jgi:hypothetical protein
LLLPQFIFGRKELEGGDHLCMYVCVRVCVCVYLCVCVC